MTQERDAGSDLLRQLKCVTVLIADHDSTVRRRASAILASQGYRIVEATSEEDLLDQVLQNQRSIDLIVADIEIFRLSRFQVIEQILSFSPSMKVIFLADPHALGGAEIDPRYFTVLPRECTAEVLLLAVQECRSPQTAFGSVLDSFRRFRRT